MKVEDAEYLSIKIRDEGFHYCFKHYSRFEDIDDEEFHKLRKYYLQIYLRTMSRKSVVRYLTFF